MVAFFHPIPASQLVESREDFLVSCCRGKKVLHIGCVDAGLTRERLADGRLLHSRLISAAQHVTGVDIDEAGLEVMRAAGIEDLHLGSIESGIPVEGVFDLVIAGEVIEHLSAPGKLIESCLPLLHTGAKLVITAPNAFCLTTIMRIFRGVETVHEDHVSYYSFATLKSLLARYNLQIEEFGFYSDKMRPKGIKKIVKSIYHLLLRRLPQFGEGIIIVARARG